MLHAYIVLIALLTLSGYFIAQISVAYASLPSLQSDSSIHEYLIDLIDVQHKKVEKLIKDTLNGN